MKKIIALLLSAGMLIISLGITPAMAEETDYTHYINFVEKLGIIPDVSASKATVTRGQMADYIRNIVTGGARKVTSNNFFADDLNDTLIELTDTASVFDDVPESNPHYAGIKRVNELGIMNGTGHKIFSPDSEITFNQVAITLVRLLGYARQVKNNNYLSPAENMGMFEGIIYSENDKITFEQLAMVFYNCFDIDVMQIKNEDGKITLSPKTGVNIYREYMDIQRTSGQLEKNPFASIYGDDETAKGIVVIDKIKYNAQNNYAFYDLIGRDVEIYYKDNKKEDTKTLLWGYAKERDDVITIDSDDVIGFDNYKLTYESGDREITKNLKRNAKLIYNGTYKGNYTEADFKFENGDVTIIKPRQENDFSIIIVNNYKSMKVTRVESEEGILYAKQYYSGGVEDYILNENEIDAWRVQYYMADGTAVSLKDIATGMVIDVLESEGFIKIIASNNIIGNVSIVSVAGNNDKGTTFILSDEQKLVMPKLYYNALVSSNAEPKLNKQYNIALNSFGRIAYIESVNDTAGTEYVYMISIKQSMSAEQSAIEYLNAKGDFVTSFIQKNAKVTLQNRKTIRIKEYSDASKIVNSREEAYTGAAMVKLNEEGLITEINLPVNDGNNRENLFGAMVENEPLRFCSSPRLDAFENIACAANIVMFAVDPDISKPKEARYSLLDFSRLDNGDKERNVWAYNFYSDSAVAYCMVVEKDSTVNEAERFLNDDYMYIVTDIYEGLYDDEPVTMVQVNTCGGVADTAEYIYPAEGDCVRLAGTFFDHNKGVKLQKGDIIYANIKDGYITKALLVYRIFHEEGKSPLYDTIGRYKTSASDTETKLNPYGVKHNLELYTTYAGEGALNRVKSNSPHRFIAANLMNFELNEHITYTTLDISDGYKETLIKKNREDYGAYITETLCLPYRYTVIEVEGKNISVRKGTTADFITYKQAGEDCTELFMDTADGMARTMVLINGAR